MTNIIQLHRRRRPYLVLIGSALLYMSHSIVNAQTPISTTSDSAALRSWYKNIQKWIRVRRKVAAIADGKECLNGFYDLRRSVDQYIPEGCSMEDLHNQEYERSWTTWSQWSNCILGKRFRSRRIRCANVNDVATGLPGQWIFDQQLDKGSCKKDDACSEYTECRPIRGGICSLAFKSRECRVNLNFNTKITDHDLLKCAGNTTEKVPCKLDPVPDNWSDWSECTNGKTSQWRQKDRCDVSAGQDVNEKDCGPSTIQKIRKSGAFCQWSAWSPCSEKLGAIKIRKRRCNSKRANFWNDIDIQGCDPLKENTVVKEPEAWDLKLDPLSSGPPVKLKNAFSQPKVTEVRTHPGRFRRPIEGMSGSEAGKKSKNLPALEEIDMSTYRGTRAKSSSSIKDTGRAKVTDTLLGLQVFPKAAIGPMEKDTEEVVPADVLEGMRQAQIDGMKPQMKPALPGDFKATRAPQRKQSKARLPPSCKWSKYSPCSEFVTKFRVAICASAAHESLLIRLNKGMEWKICGTNELIRYMYEWSDEENPWQHTTSSRSRHTLSLDHYMEATAVTTTTAPLSMYTIEPEQQAESQDTPIKANADSDVSPVTTTVYAPAKTTNLEATTEESSFFGIDRTSNKNNPQVTEDYATANTPKVIIKVAKPLGTGSDQPKQDQSNLPPKNIPITAIGTDHRVRSDPQVVGSSEAGQVQGRESRPFTAIGSQSVSPDFSGHNVRLKLAAGTGGVAGGTSGGCLWTGENKWGECVGGLRSYTVVNRCPEKTYSAQIAC